MVKGALFVGWGAIIPGREESAQKVLGEAMGYLQQLQQDGSIDSFDVVALEPYGGSLAAFVVVKGEKEAMAQLRVSDEFVRLVIRVQLVHRDVRVLGAYTGAEVQSLFAMWDQQSEELV